MNYTRISPLVSRTFVIIANRLYFVKMFFSTFFYFSFAVISPIITAPINAPKENIKKYNTHPTSIYIYSPYGKLFHLFREFIHLNKMTHYITEYAMGRFKTTASFIQLLHSLPNSSACQYLCLCRAPHNRQCTVWEQQKQ